MNIKIGIIGFGDGGKASLEGVISAGAKVLAISDINEENFISENYKNIEFYKNSLSLIKHNDINLIIIATPDNQHFCDIELALQSGKYVFVEKPLVTTEKELREIKTLALQYPGKLLFSEKYSFSPLVELLLNNKEALGDYLYGTTFYTHGFSNKIMGGGKWRTECAYNPCAGGLSHNFMVALLLVKSDIKRVRAIGKILTYHNNLNDYGGYDFMEGALEFHNGTTLNWIVDLSTTNNNCWFERRTTSYFLQFKNGSLACNPSSGNDVIKIEGKPLDMRIDSCNKNLENYNNQLYTKMFKDVFNSIVKNQPSRHNIIQGINVTKACIFAYKSAKKGGGWIDISVN